jgi:hypothetical protein
MRKFMVVPLAGLFLLGTAAPAFAAPDVGNYGGSATIVQGGWDSYSEDKDGYQSGSITVYQETGSAETFVDYSEYSEALVQCTGADTPDDPDDDTWASMSSFRYGYGEATLSIAKRSASAAASGTISVIAGTFDGCTGDETYGDPVDMPFTLSLTATSGTIKESSRGSFKLPGVFNSHSSYKSTYRLAEGTLDVGGDAHEAYGQFGVVSWMDHSNG